VISTEQTFKDLKFIDTVLLGCLIQVNLLRRRIPSKVHFRTSRDILKAGRLIKKMAKEHCLDLDALTAQQSFDRWYSGLSFGQKIRYHLDAPWT